MADTFEEAIRSLSAEDAETRPVCVIDNDLRTITTPSNFILGVYNDKDVHEILFSMPRYYNDIDLSVYSIRVNYINAAGTENDYYVETKDVLDDTIKFSWLTSRMVFSYAGEVRFSVCLRNTDEEGVIINEFNTTIASGIVLEGIEVDDHQEDPEISDLIVKITKAKDDAETAAKQSEENVTHYPKIENGKWIVYDANNDAWVDTGIAAQGPKGDTGETGAKGDTGTTPDFHIGAVYNVPYGQSATASITGTPERPILSLAIPEGARGAKGDTGATGPKGDTGAIGTPLVASTASEMTDTTRLYIYVGSESGYSNGHWYHYDGTAWVDGGLYNAVAVQTDKSLSIEGMAADSAATGEAIDDLKADLDYIGDYVAYDYPSVDYNDLLAWGERTVVPCSIAAGDKIKIEYYNIDTPRALTIGICESGDTISQRFMNAETVSTDGSVTVEAEVDAVNYVLFTPTYSTQIKLTRLAREGFALKGVKIINAVQHGVKEGTHIYNAMNAILDSIGNDGAVIYLPKGIYTCNGAIQWKSNVSLVGDGIGQTIIKSVYGTVFAGSNLDNITFRDFTIDGADNASPDHYGKGIFFTYITNATFENLEIINTKESGLGCDFFINGTIHNVRCDNCGWGGDLTDEAFGCSGLGIGIGRYNRGMEALSVSNCHADNCKQYGIFFERQFSSEVPTDFPVGVSVVGCTAEGNRVGFGVSGCDNIVFSACTAYDNNAAGFALDYGTMGDEHSHGTRPKFIGCVAKSNGKSLPVDYPQYYGVDNGHGFIALDKFLGMELVGCSSIDNLKNGLYIVDGIEELEVLGGTFDENGNDGIKVDGTLSRFRISPSFAQNNNNVGVEFGGAVNRGSLKDAVITGNSIGVKASVTPANTFVKDNSVYDNLAFTNLDTFTTGVDTTRSLTIANGTPLKITVVFTNMNVYNNFTLALMKNGSVVQKPFDGLEPSVATNTVTVTTTDNIDAVKIAKSGGTVNVKIDAIGAEQNWVNVIQA